MHHSSQTPHKHPNHCFVYAAAQENTFRSFRLFAVIALTKLQMHVIVKKASPTNVDPPGTLSCCPRQQGNEYICTVTPATDPHPVPRLPRQSSPRKNRGEPEHRGVRRGRDSGLASPRRHRAPRRAPGPAPAAPLTPAAGRSWWRRAAAPRGSARGPRCAAGRGPRAAAASAPLPGHGHAVTPRGGAGRGGGSPRAASGPGAGAAAVGGRGAARHCSVRAARPEHPSPASRTNGKPRGTHVAELCACWDKRDAFPPPSAAPPLFPARHSPRQHPRGSLPLPSGLLGFIHLSSAKEATTKNVNISLSCVCCPSVMSRELTTPHRGAGRRQGYPQGYDHKAGGTLSVTGKPWEEGFGHKITKYQMLFRRTPPFSASDARAAAVCRLHPRVSAA